MFFSEIDTGSPSGNVLTFVAGQLGVVGALIWYLWWMTSREMPKGRQDFLEALDRQRERYGNLLNAQREEIRHSADVLGELAQANQDLADAVREALDLRRSRRPLTNPPPPP